MSGVLCVWVADLPASSEKWYEDEYIPEMMSSRSQKALLGETIETPLDKEVERDLQWTSFAMYEIDDVQKAVPARFDESKHQQILDGSSFDARTYEEVKIWQDGDWNGDGADVASILLFEWQPLEGYEQQVVDFYQSDIGPLFSMAAEILRLRWFKVKDTSLRIADSDQTLSREAPHTYISIAEMNCEEWPWGELFALDNIPQWSEYFEGQKAVKWQASHYVVKRSYPGSGSKGSSDE